MKVLFVTGRRYPPDRHGGAQSSAHALLRRVVARGHPAEAAVERAPGPGLLLFRFAHFASGHRWFGSPDNDNGYPTHRAARWQVPRLAASRIEAFRPDVVLVDQVEMIEALDGAAPRIRVPVVLRIADVSFRLRDPSFARRENLRIFANSRFIADALRDHAQIDAPVLYPIVEPAAFRTEAVEPRTVTFINPIEGKGLDVALRTAELLPDVPFLFVSGWPRPNEETARLEQRIAPLRNVTLAPWSADVRNIYARTRVLLFPARWEEGFGRVVLEAHANGIPVVASDRGGLPEAVGEGGVVLPYDAPDTEWATAVASLMGDASVHARYAGAATENLKRAEFDGERIADRFLALLSGDAG